MNRIRLYQMVYALAAQDGRKQALFGESAPRALEAFERSLAGTAFPELWFELPLAGEPWFDLHALTSRETVAPGDAFDAANTGGNPGVFEWFAAQERGVRQLALSWDTGRGDTGNPAVQLLVTDTDEQVTCDFLQAAGRPDAQDAYRRFIRALPDGWFACYTGVFPGRPGHNLRVECIPAKRLQRAYAQDSPLLARHLRQVGLQDVGGTLSERCRIMADTPFNIEFQFDVEPDGRAGATFSASLRFARPPREGEWEGFLPDGAAGELMSRVEAWGLADDRWRLLADTVFSMSVKRGGEGGLLYCFPAFLKLKWHAGVPVDAKAYLMAGMQ